jgi:hypothetical protein
MILPRYSLRVILLVVAICAVLSLVVSLGLRGKPWAAGVSMGLLALLVTMILGALSFALIWAFTAALGGSRRSDSTSHEERADKRDKPPVRTH